MRSTLVTGLATLAALIVAVAAEAQSLGTFRWQLQPYCNVITVTVVQDGQQEKFTFTVPPDFVK